MKNTTILAIIIIIILVAGAFIYFNSGSISPSSGSNTNVQTENAQKITIGIKNYNYYPNTITVKEGVPVEITLDNSVVGCYRSFTIRDLGVQKNSRSPSDKITFTPAKKGTFRFACSMGMGTGTIIVE